MRPIARLCVRNAFPLKDIIEVLKGALIEASVSELRAGGQEISVSKIHVMSGVPRLEVSRIYVKGEDKSSGSNVIIRIINRWQQDERFLTRSGKPKVLSSEGLKSEFVELVTSVSLNLNPYTILFELERIGAVEKTPRGIRLRSRSYKTTDLQEGYQFLGEDVSDLIESVQKNLEGSESSPNHHIKTEFTNIPFAFLEEIRKWIEHEGANFHKKVRSYLARFDRDLSPRMKSVGGKTVRIALGSFSNTEEVIDRDSERKE